MIEMLRNELTLDPTALGYAALIAAGTHTGVMKRINLPEVTRIQPGEHWLTDRGLVSEIVPQHGVALIDSIFSKFNLAATQSPTVERMVSRLYADANGLNFGDAALRGMFLQWRGTLLTEAEADALLTVSTRPVSRAVELFGRDVSLNEVSEALSNGG